MAIENGHCLINGIFVYPLEMVHRIDIVFKSRVLLSVSFRWDCEQWCRCWLGNCCTVLFTWRIELVSTTLFWSLTWWVPMGEMVVLSRATIEPSFASKSANRLRCLYVLWMGTDAHYILLHKWLCAPSVASLSSMTNRISNPSSLLGTLDNCIHPNTTEAPLRLGCVWVSLSKAVWNAVICHFFI